LVASGSGDPEERERCIKLAMGWLGEDLTRRERALVAYRETANAAQIKAAEAERARYLAHAFEADPDLEVLRSLPEFKKLRDEISPK
jgi:hypothetical protein